MCDIAPLQMKCVNDELNNKLDCCKFAHLSQAWNNLQRSLPIIGNLFDEYHCLHFEPYKESEEEWRRD